MNVLFVAPNHAGSGEAVTAMHVGRQLVRSGHHVRYFADRFTSRFVADASASPVEELSDVPGETAARWHDLLRRFVPDCVVFADYPLLRLSRRSRVLLEDANWRALERTGAALITFDHLGLAQRPLTLPFGPAHLELMPEHLPGLPPGMKILLPCPLQSPQDDGSRSGVPFRCWDVPLTLHADRREEVRRRYLRDPDELLVFHTVSSWAVEFCRRHGLPNYRFLTRLFEDFFRAASRQVTVVSVNGGALLPASSASRLRIVNLGQLPADAYDEILLASDLVVSDNRISVTLGKAVCGMIPCAALRNTHRLLEIVERGEPWLAELVLRMERERAGAVFPFEVFPIWSRADVAALGLFSQNPLEQCVALLEMYGGEATRRAFEELLTAETSRLALRAHQEAYVSAIARLPTAEEALLQVLE